MASIVVRNLTIGEGMPKICVPIAETTQEGIVHAAQRIKGEHADLVEWRADWFEDVFLTEKLQETLEALRQVLGEMPLLFTFRTRKEGGEKEIEPEAYGALNQAAAETGCIDLLDVEVFMEGSAVKEIIDTAHRNHVKVIASNHDFCRTPEQKEIVYRLCRMHELGADVSKIAVMPQSKQDVLTLLAATEEMQREHTDIPVITMSMSGRGLISRLCGELFGSVITFGCVGRESAPGQIEANELARLLFILHQNFDGIS